jgi:hypothetical protein
LVVVGFVLVRRCTSALLALGTWQSLCPDCAPFEANFSAVWHLPGFAQQLNYTQV